MKRAVLAAAKNLSSYTTIWEKKALLHNPKTRRKGRIDLNGFKAPAIRKGKDAGRKRAAGFGRDARVCCLHR